MRQQCYVMSKGEHSVFKASKKNSVAISILVCTLGCAVHVKEDGNEDIPGEGIACQQVHVSWDKPLTKLRLLGIAWSWSIRMSAQQFWAAPGAQPGFCRVLNLHWRSAPSTLPPTGVRQGERLNSHLGSGYLTPCSAPGLCHCLQLC